ncbi:uncharacterized protein LOC142558024 [Dermacentor variabilis]|uniref:uncharacterized protein LOC142558024 n=1 Tax=Dermacentor variabilis TaxID=34621 RepID=UPI003F5C0AF7
MVATTFTKLAAGFVLLSAFVFGRGNCEDQRCDVLEATSCYWNTAVKYVAKNIVFKLAAETAHLKKLCDTNEALPPVSYCAPLYAGCSEEVRMHFAVPENGYRIVQKDLMDRAKCEGLGVLNSCIDSSALLRSCRISLALEPTVENAHNNFKAASTLRRCLRDVLSSCSKGEHHYAKDHIINSYGLALTELFWDSSASMLQAVSSAWTTTTIKVNDTDGNPTLTPALRSGAAVMLPLSALLLLLITLSGIYTV